MSKKNKIKDENEVLEERRDEQLSDTQESQTTNAETQDVDSEETVSDKIALLEEALDNEKDRSLRLFAEFENYRKRTARERIEMFKTAGEDIVLSLLPVLDDFERALKEYEKREDDGAFTGVKLISNKLRDTLKNKGLESIEVNPGDKFDLDIHEAITKIPAPDKKLKGKIVDVVERGYTLGGKIIRFPKVVVGE